MSLVWSEIPLGSELGNCSVWSLEYVLRCWDTWYYFLMTDTCSFLNGGAISIHSGMKCNDITISILNLAYLSIDWRHIRNRGYFNPRKIAGSTVLTEAPVRNERKSKMKNERERKEEEQEEKEAGLVIEWKSGKGELYIHTSSSHHGPQVATLYSKARVRSGHSPHGVALATPFCQIISSKSRTMTRQTFPDAYGRQSDQGSSRHMEDAPSDDCDTLPSYESPEDLPPVAAPKPPKPTDNAEGSDRASVQQEYSRTLSEYFNEYDQGFELKMAPDADVLIACPTPQWLAVLVVKSRDVPRLMREGFFWSTENVVPEEGYMSSETRRDWAHSGLHYKRTWMLADKSNDETPQWVARLEVNGRFPDVLPGFRVQNLSRANVFAARAWNGPKHTYAWDSRFPVRYNYNCIYDDRPLQGWWPWPREEGTYVGYSAMAMEDEADELVEEPPASRCQPQGSQRPPESHEAAQQSSGCVIL